MNIIFCGISCLYSCDYVRFSVCVCEKKLPCWLIHFIFWNKWTKEVLNEKQRSKCSINSTQIYLKTHVLLQNWKKHEKVGQNIDEIFYTVWNISTTNFLFSHNEHKIYDSTISRLYPYSFRFDSISFTGLNFISTEKNEKLFVSLFCSLWFRHFFNCVYYACIRSSPDFFRYALKCFQQILLLSCKAYPFTQFQWNGL